MGLDNGLIIRPISERAKKFMKENFEDLKNTYSSELEYEFLYARKCWNIRARFNELGFLEDGSYKKIYIKELPIVINKILKYFLKEENWEEDGSSIWQWYIMVPSIANAIRDLKMFLDYLNDYLYCDGEEFTDSDFDISFYDSY